MQNNLQYQNKEALLMRNNYEIEELTTKLKKIEQTLKDKNKELAQIKISNESSTNNEKCKYIAFYYL